MSKSSYNAEYPDYVSIRIDKDRLFSRLYRGIVDIVETHGLSDTTCQTLYGISEFLENIENREDGFFCLDLADVRELEGILEDIELSDDDEKRFEIPSDLEKDGSVYYKHAYDIVDNAYDYYRSEIREDLLHGNLSATCFDVQNLAEHLELALMVFDHKMGHAKAFLKEKTELNPDGFDFEQVDEEDFNFIMKSGIANVSGIHETEDGLVTRPARANDENREELKKRAIKKKNHLRSVT